MPTWKAALVGDRPASTRANAAFSFSLPCCHRQWNDGNIAYCEARHTAGRYRKFRHGYCRKPISDYLRITVGTDAQIDRLLSTLSEIFGGTPTTPP
jgi:hypothetical protein